MRVFLRWAGRSSPRVLPALLALALAACATTSGDRDLARVRYDMAIQAQRAGDPRGALQEIAQAVEAAPDDPEIRNFHALVLHLHFGQLDRAIKEYRKAIELRPNYSEAKLNLGAALIAAGRYEEALAPLDEARQDLVFHDAHLAEGNYGWAKYKLGDEAAAIEHLNLAVTLTPAFCLGYRNLAEIHGARGDLPAALRELDRYAKACPAEADADLRRGLVYLRQGEGCLARDAFASCVGKAAAGPLGAECEKRAEEASCTEDDVEIVIEGN
jgi:type IV pilus assembly protein PilF